MNSHTNNLRASTTGSIFNRLFYGCRFSAGILSKSNGLAQRSLLLALVFLLPMAVFATTFSVTTTADSGAGSLREAIGLANANAGADDIVFSTTGTLTLATSLPSITDAVTITGSPGFVIAGGSNIVFSISNANNVTLEDLDMSSGTGLAVNITGGSNITLDNNNLSGHSSAITSSSTDGLTITGNNLNNTGFGQYQKTLSMTSVLNPFVSGNTWTGVGVAIQLSVMTGIDIDNTNANGAEIVLENANGFKDCSTCLNLSSMTNTTVKNVDMSNGAGPAVNISGGSNITLDNNNLSGHNSAITSSSTDGLTITGNNLNNTGFGSYQKTLSMTSVLNPSVSGNTWTGTGVAIQLSVMTGIDIDNTNANGAEIVLENANGFKDCSTCLNLSSMTNTTVKNVDMSNGTGLAVNITGGSNITLDNNNLSGHSSAIRSSSTDGLTITGNNLNNTGFGQYQKTLSMTSVLNPSVSGNTWTGVGVAIQLSVMTGIDIDNTNANGAEIVLENANGFKDCSTCLNLSSMTNTTVKNVDMSNGTGLAVNITGGSNITLDNNNLSGHSSAIRSSSTNGLTITGNNLNNTGFGSYQKTLSMTSVLNPSVSGNTWTGTNIAIQLSSMTGIDIDNTNANGAEIVLENANGFKDCSTCLNLSSMTNTTVKNVDMSNGTGLAVNITGGSNITLDNNNLSGHSSAIRSSSTNGLTITGNNLNNTGFGSYQKTLSMTSVLNPSVSGNTWTGVGVAIQLSSMTGIDIDNTNANGAEIVLEDANGFKDCSTCLNLSSMTNTTVKNVDMSNGAGLAVYISGGSNITLDNNNLSGHGSAITSSSTDGLTITGNNLNNTGSGQYQRTLSMTSVLNPSVSGNTWTGVATAIQLSSMTGIDIDNTNANGAEIVLEDANGFKDCSTCLNLSSMTNTTVKNLLLTSGGASAISFVNSTNNLVSNIAINGHSTGVSLNNSSDNTIECSTFTNISTAAVLVSGTSTNTSIDNNSFACLTGFAVDNNTTPAIDAENNFYGYDADPVAGDFDGTVNFDPFLNEADACAPDGSVVCAELVVPPSAATALNFDGVDDYIKSSNPVQIFGSQPTTVEFWMNADLIASRRSPIGIGTNRYYFYQPGTWSLWGENSFNGKSFGESLSTNTWTHVAITYDGVNTLSLYLDGEPAATPTHTLFIAGINDFIYVGHRGDLGVGVYYDGGIDEVRVWTQERSAAEILANYDQEIAVMPPCLALYYKMNQGFVDADNTGINTADDTSTNLQNDGNLNNFALVGSTSNWTEGAGVTELTSTYDPFSEISITGNGQNIADGDNAATTTDGTDFGTQIVGQTASSIFTITNSGTGDLDLTAYSSDQAEFTFAAGSPTVITAGQTADFTIVFTPTNDTPVNGIITINNNDCDEDPYTFAVTGEGEIMLDFIWDNDSGDGLWSTAINWSSDVVPGAGDDVFFDSNVSNAYCTVDAISVVNNMTIDFNGKIIFSQELTVNNDLRITNVSFLEDGAIAVKGNVITNDDGYQYYAYQCTDIKLIGSGNQTISGTGVIHDLDIQKVGGDVLLSGNLSLLSGKLTGSGLLKNTGGLVKIIGAYEFDFGGSIDDVEFDTAQKIIFSQELTVNNDLRITNVSFLEDGAIAVKGNVITNDDGYQYYAYQCTDIKLIGSGNQTISGTGVIHDLDIQKVGGDVLLSGNLSLLSGKLTGSGLLKNTGGLVKIIGAYEFDFGGSIDDVEFDTAQKNHIQPRIDRK